MSSVLTESRLRIPAASMTDKNVKLALTSAMAVIGNPDASDSDRTITLHEIDVAYQQHLIAMQERAAMRRKKDRRND